MSAQAPESYESAVHCGSAWYSRITIQGPAMYAALMTLLYVCKIDDVMVCVIAHCTFVVLEEGIDVADWSLIALFLFHCSAKVAEEKLRYAAYNCIAIDTDMSTWDDWCRLSQGSQSFLWNWLHEDSLI